MIEGNTAHVASIACLSLFAVIGVFDGLFFHMWKYRLHEHAESRTEHLIHTTRAFCLALFGLFFFVTNAGGWLLWSAVGLLFADLGLEVWDVLVEKEARANLGGISSEEQAVHVVATGFKTASLALILIAKPVTAWSVTSPMILAETYPLFVVLAGAGFTTSTLVGGFIHIWTMKPLSRAGLPHTSYRAT